MQNAEWSCMEEFDDINTKDQYQVASTGRAVRERRLWKSAVRNEPG